MYAYSKPRGYLKEYEKSTCFPESLMHDREVPAAATDRERPRAQRADFMMIRGKKVEALGS